MSITYITPFNCDSRDSYLYERAKFFLSESYTSEKTKRIFIDFASKQDISEELEIIANANGITYLKLERHGELYSSGICRNVGAIEADTKFISFQDVDLFASDELYRKIEHRIDNYEYINELEIIPCLYLTEEYSIEYLDSDEVARSDKIQKAFIENDKKVIHMYAPTSSCKVVERKFYLLSGGMNREFYGHGFEDFELHYRMCDMSKKFYRTHSPSSHDYQYDALEYKGYRPFFSMFGRPLMSEGLYFVHLWHDNHVGTNYQKRNKANRKIFERLMKEHDEGKLRLPSLPNIHTDEKILVLASKRSINANSLRQVFATIGNCTYRDELTIHSTDELKEIIESNDFNRVFFFNPYGNEHRLNLYRYCKETCIPFYIFDRGALNDSWFIDPNGFNGDSSSYDRVHWDNKLSSEQISETREYIHQTFLVDDTLEKNGERIGVEHFKEKYSPDDKKILFVPFQRPNDSVIKHFSGNVDNVEDFTYKLRIIADKLSSDWVVVAKKHPLESKISLPDNVVELPASTHVYDCIQSSDAVLLINSGVGLLSAMANKPVYHFGKTYYAHEDIACEIFDENDAVEKIKNGFKPNIDSVTKFIFHLVNNVYSFAKTDYRIENSAGGSSRNVAVLSKFSKINILSGSSYDSLWREEPYSTQTRFYDYYRGYFHKENQRLTNKTTSAPSPKPSAKPTVYKKNAATANIIPKQNKKYGAKHKMKKLMNDPIGVFKRKVTKLTS